MFSESDIPDCLYTLNTETRCRGVYQEHSSYYVRVKHNRKVRLIGTRDTLEQAVRFLTAYYRERFGPHWERIVHSRESNPWKVIQGRSGAQAGKFVLVVWLFGHARRVEPAPGVVGWATRKAALRGARRAIRAFLARELDRRGLPRSYLDGDYPMLWRIKKGHPVPPAPRRGSVWWRPRRPALAGSAKSH